MLHIQHAICMVGFFCLMGAFFNACVAGESHRPNKWRPSIILFAVGGALFTFACLIY